VAKTLAKRRGEAIVLPDDTQMPGGSSPERRVAHNKNRIAGGKRLSTETGSSLKGRRLRRRAISNSLRRHTDHTIRICHNRICRKPHAFEAAVHWLLRSKGRSGNERQPPELHWEAGQAGKRLALLRAGCWPEPGDGSSRRFLPNRSARYDRGKPSCKRRVKWCTFMCLR
jgi:hypothetical protein